MVQPYFISSRSHPKLMFCENLPQDFHLRRLMTLLSNINEHVTFHGPEWKLVSCDAGLSACFMLKEIIRICFSTFFKLSSLFAKRGRREDFVRLFNFRLRFFFSARSCLYNPRSLRTSFSNSSGIVESLREMTIWVMTFSHEKL